MMDWRIIWLLENGCVNTTVLLLGRFAWPKAAELLFHFKPRYISASNIRRKYGSIPCNIHRSTADTISVRWLIAFVVVESELFFSLYCIQCLCVWTPTAHHHTASHSIADKSHRQHAQTKQARPLRVLLAFSFSPPFVFVLTRLPAVLCRCFSHLAGNVKCLCLIRRVVLPATALVCACVVCVCMWIHSCVARAVCIRPGGCNDDRPKTHTCRIHLFYIHTHPAVYVTRAAREVTTVISVLVFFPLWVCSRVVCVCIYDHSADEFWSVFNTFFTLYIADVCGRYVHRNCLPLAGSYVFHATATILYNKLISYLMVGIVGHNACMHTGKYKRKLTYKQMPCAPAREWRRATKRQQMVKKRTVLVYQTSKSTVPIAYALCYMWMCRNVSAVCVCCVAYICVDWNDNVHVRMVSSKCAHRFQWGE